MNAERQLPALPRLLGPGMAAAAAALLLGQALLAAVGVAGHLLGSPAPAPVESGGAMLADIPAAYLRLYVAAAARYGLDWAVLAGIGKVECDHGRDPDPSCTHEGVTNSAGAGGPAQFLASTWRTYGVDGDGDGTIDRWDAADAIFSMAAYLRASGAPRDYRRALFAYNHSWGYVAQVERWAAAYRAAAAQTRGSWPWQSAAAARFVPGSQALLAAWDGHLALVPEQAPAAVQAMVIAGNELQDLPYGPAGHPDPRGATSEDCSSAVNYVLYRSGVRSIDEIVRDNPLAQDYVHWGEPGPGQWVSIYATASPSDHVFIVIAGLRLDTSHNGTDVGPNRLEDGPRWRLLDYIPTWARWTVRHPPGL